MARFSADKNPGGLSRAEYKDWYAELFQRFATAGLVRAGDLAGYRKNAVYLRTSRYVPPRWAAVRDATPAYFDLLEKETEPYVRAMLGQWFFGYIHPYPDGNGRMARFLMNVMLASGGYPWTVIRLPKGPQELSRRVGSACFRVFSVLQKPLQWSTCGIARNRTSRLSMESPCSVSTARGSRCVKPPLLIWPTYNQESAARRCRTARTPRPEPIAGLPRPEVILPRSEPAHW